MSKKKGSPDALRKQTKNSKFHRPKSWIYASASLVIAVILLGVASSLWFTLSKSKEPKDLSTFIKILEEHKYPRDPITQIWFTSTFQTPGVSGDTLTADARVWIANQWSQVKLRLDSYHEDNLRQLALIFDQSTPGAVTGRTSSGLNFGLIYFNTSPAALQQSQSGLKIAFYGRGQFETDLKGLLLKRAGYAPEPHVIFVPACVGYDPVVEDALFFHELTHVRQQRQKEAFGGEIRTRDNEGRKTDFAVDDEIEAHTVERQVIEIGTKGEYGRRITKIVLSKGNVVDPVKLILNVTPAEFDWIDEALNQPAAEETGDRSGQYLYDLGRECISVHTPERDQQTKLRAFYRTLTDSYPDNK